MDTKLVLLVVILVLSPVHCHLSSGQVMPLLNVFSNEADNSLIQCASATPVTFVNEKGEIMNVRESYDFGGIWATNVDFISHIGSSLGRVATPAPTKPPSHGFLFCTTPVLSSVTLPASQNFQVVLHAINDNEVQVFKVTGQHSYPSISGIEIMLKDGEATVKVVGYLLGFVPTTIDQFSLEYQGTVSSSPSSE